MGGSEEGGGPGGQVGNPQFAYEFNLIVTATYFGHRLGHLALIWRSAESSGHVLDLLPSIRGRLAVCGEEGWVGGAERTSPGGCH